MTTAAKHRPGDSSARRGSRPTKAQQASGNGSPRRPKDCAFVLTSAIHLLEERLDPLAASAHPFRRPSRRYEDLCLIERVIGFERELLDSATESEADAATLSTLSTAIELSHKRLAFDLERSGRWLSEEARKRAEEAAAGRFDAIAAELARELGRAPNRPGRERALQTRSAPRTAADAPRPAPWSAFVAIASRGVATASRRLSVAPRRVAVSARARVARMIRLARNRGLAQAQAGDGMAASVNRMRAVGAASVVVALAAFMGITGVLSGGRPGSQGGSAYGSSGSGALHARTPEAHATALAKRGRRGIASSRDRNHSRHAGHGQSRNRQTGSGAGGGGGNVSAAGGGGQTTGTGRPYASGDSTPIGSSPVTAPSYTSGSGPTSTSTPSSSSSDGPVTSTVGQVDQTASNAGVNTGASGATSGVTRQVDGTVNNLSNDVSGTTDGLLGK